MQNVSPLPAPPVRPPSLHPWAARLIVEKPDSPGETDGRIVPRELVCAHSQVERINLGLGCSRKHTGARVLEGGSVVQTRVSGLPRLGSGGGRAQRSRSVIFWRRCVTSKTIYPGNPHPEPSRTPWIPFSTEGRVLRFSARLLAESAETLRLPTLNISFGPRPPGVRRRKASFVDEPVVNSRP